MASMRIGYLDCFAGIAGDMLLGALIEAGVPVEVLERATAGLNIGASLKIERVDRSGISCTKVHVLEGGELAEGKAHKHEQSHTHSHEQSHKQSHEPSHKHSHEHEHEHTHSHQHDLADHDLSATVPHAAETAPLHTHEHGDHKHDHGHKHDHEHKHSHEHKHTHEHEHSHKHEHSHDHGHHDHPHVHGRSLSEIRALILAAELAEPVRRMAIRAFELLGASEAKIHNVPVDGIHFHEVGAVDAIVDIVAASAGLHHLNVGRWYASEVNVGGGMVECAHGTFPVPAPATADLLRGVPTYSAHVQKELVTPTGAALLRALEPEFGPQPAMRVERVGYGAGTRNPKNFPNVLRLSVGEATGAEARTKNQSNSQIKDRHVHAHTGETVTVVETALDDCSPQVLAHVAERALAAGALDVMMTPVIMKKGRPGTLLTVLAIPEDAPAMQSLLLNETSTLGVRMRDERRVCLDRRIEHVDTPFGAIRMKIGSTEGEERNAAPEFEDCRTAAEKFGVAVKTVQSAAMAAWIQSTRG